MLKTNLYCPDCLRELKKRPSGRLYCPDYALCEWEETDQDKPSTEADMLHKRLAYSRKAVEAYMQDIKDMEKRLAEIDGQ